MFPPVFLGQFGSCSLLTGGRAVALTFKGIKDTTAKQYQCYVLIFEKERN